MFEGFALDLMVRKYQRGNHTVLVTFSVKNQPPRQRPMEGTQNSKGPGPREGKAWQQAGEAE